MKTPDDASEVLILDATGRDADDSDRIREELVRRGLRVKIETVAPLHSSILLSRVIDQAGGSDYCILLMPEQEEGLIEKRGTIAYLAIPKREYTLLPGNETLPGSRLSIGRLNEGVDALADRIAAFLEFARRESKRLDEE